MFSQGAKVKRRYIVEPSRNIEHVGLGPTPGLHDEAYRLAKANQHKPWARRWLRERHYL